MIRRSQHQEVEVPITPMLDMAFQLLTFFVLTYRPAPAEGQYAMNLLPAAPVASPNAAPADADATPDPNLPAALRTLTTQLRAGSDGGLGRVMIGEVEVQGMEGLRARLKEIRADKDSAFDQALIQADPLLKYEELMRVIDVFATENLTKISFGELTEGAAGGSP